MAESMRPFATDAAGKCTRKLWPVLLLLISTLNVHAEQTPGGKQKFGELQCRADAQRWTYDPFDKELSPKYLTGALIQVNGQVRTLPTLTYGASVHVLLDRIYEATVCMQEDAEFQAKYNTYRLLRDAYTEERSFRYMDFILRHDLEKQFSAEDTERYK